MNTAELIAQSSVVFDAAGVAGLCLLAFAAIRLARREHSWGGNLMAIGAISLLIARLVIVVSNHFVTHEMLAAWGPNAISAQLALPAILLSFGLAGVVWGLWGHSKWLHDGR